MSPLEQRRAAREAAFKQGFVTKECVGRKPTQRVTTGPRADAVFARCVARKRPHWKPEA